MAEDTPRLETLFGSTYQEPRSFLGSVNEFFADPNNQRLLAGLGAAINPTPGMQAVSNVVGSLVGSRAAQQAVAEQSRRSNLLTGALLRLAGGVTPPGTEGPTGVKRNKDGTLDITGVTLPGETMPTAPSTAPPHEVQPTGPVAPAAPTATSTTTERARTQLSDIIPFY